MFAVEFGVKLALVQHRRRYLITHWLDLLTLCVPFLRPLRLLRLAVVAARFWRPSKYILRKQTWAFIGVTSAAVIVGSAVAVYAFERRAGGTILTFGDALWWTVTTVTTVGYGDVYPITPAGRVVTVFLAFTGISPSPWPRRGSRPSSWMRTSRTRSFRKLRRIAERLDQIERALSSQSQGLDSDERS